MQQRNAASHNSSSRCRTKRTQPWAILTLQAWWGSTLPLSNGTMVSDLICDGDVGVKIAGIIVPQCGFMDDTLI
jgi:hypothetical protein